MTWLYLTLVGVIAFALLKMRRRRKVRQAGSAFGYRGSRAA